MITLLRKLFIKNYKDVNDPNVRRKHGVMATIIGFIFNIIVFSFKLLIGLIIHSISIISDALNNLSDMGTGVVNLIGFNLSNKKPDKKHPYGYGRIEYIAGLVVSFIIIILAVVLAYTSITRIIQGQLSDYTNRTFVIVTYVILVVSILFKLLQGLIYRKVGKLIDSVLLKAASQDSFNDVLSTSVVLISTIVEFILYLNSVTFNLDAYMGIIVSVFVLYSGIKLVIETSSPLIGNLPNHELIKSLSDDILKYPNVLGLHDMIFHSYGVNVTFVICHVEVDYRLKSLDSHDLIDKIEKEMSYKYRLVLTIHVDPIVTDDEKQNALEKQVAELIYKYNPKIRYHDFRLKSSDLGTLLDFDVVIPYEKDIDEEKFLNYLNEEIKKIDTKYKLCVNVDHDFIN